MEFAWIIICTAFVLVKLLIYFICFVILTLCKKALCQSCIEYTALLHLHLNLLIYPFRQPHPHPHPQSYVFIP